MHRQGASVRASARALRLSRNTVTKYVCAEVFPKRRPAPPKRSIVEEFAAYVSARWGEGCHNAAQLWREMRGRSFTGGRTPVCFYFKRLRAGLPTHLRHGNILPPRVGAPSPRSAAWLLQQEAADLRPDERQFVSRLVSRSPGIRDATELVRRFRQIVRGRQAGEVDTWLAEAAVSTLGEVRNFAEALRRDYKAVRAASENDWSNGQAEGQVNKLRSGRHFFASGNTPSVGLVRRQQR